ncbi:CobW family GTP-binding protein [Parasporobacterium paucivorans]|uniref:GTPase, G3E family n=1 Tax=Parasporobacterium paucivorans DSM 15970 TaxID=1122934 RepID=A0A1M6IH45_9FIRM|nr:CobW family GTP-binding protein [Parasporobacterium paucivorans]SHJ33749.1 GTPase, G3E family [Parasporobacterium paucivorans DSM 15970]
MIQMILLTGFLGAGKTTLLNHLYDYFDGTKMGVIVNEFGEINIDARLLKKDGVTISELSNGSIFCACIKENFIKSLIEMSSYDIEYLFIEASGLADPSNMDQILCTIGGQTPHPYHYAGSVCVLDGEAFMELYNLLPAVRNQLVYAGAVVVNKEDLISPAVREEIQAEIRSVNPDATVYFTSFCNVDVRELIQQINPSGVQGGESSNTVESRPQTFVVKVLPSITMEEFKDFLHYISPFTYRIKGFVTVGSHSYSVSGVRTHIMILPWSSEIPASEIVLISAVGIGLTGALANGLKTNPSLGV